MPANTQADQACRSTSATSVIFALNKRTCDSIVFSAKDTIFALTARLVPTMFIL